MNKASSFLVKRFWFCGLLALAGVHLPVKAQDIRWVQKANGVGQDNAYSTAVDATGNVYVAGRFEQTVTFGRTNLNCTGRGDLFLAKYDGAGGLLWLLQGGATNDAQATSVAVGSDGSVFVCGTFDSPVRFGTNVLDPGLGYVNLFLARLTSDADVLWARQTTGTHAQVAYWQPKYSPQLTLDCRNNVCVSGSGLGGALVFSTNVLEGEGYFGFLAKYDAEGNALWARQSTITQVSPFGCWIENRGVATDADGNSYVVGGYWGGTAWFGTNSLSTNNAGFITKYNGLGNVLWVRGIGQSLEYGDPLHSYHGTAEGFELVLDAQGNLYLAGSFAGLVGFGTNTFFAIDLETFVAKYDSGGNVLWVQRGIGSCASEPEDILLNGREVWMVGWTTDYAIWGTNFVGRNPEIGQDKDDRTFLVRFDAATGNIKQVRGTGVWGCGIATDPAGDILLAGAVVDGWLGANHLTNTTGDYLGESDLFLAKIQAFPFISQHPLSQCGLWGRSVSFAVVAESPRPLAWQWQKDGTNIVGATNSTLVLTDLALGDTGSYAAAVDDGAGNAVSLPARLEMRPAAIALRLNAGLPGLTIEGVAGRNYQIQGADALGSTNAWRVLTNLTLVTSPQTWFDTASLTQHARFYRVTIP